MYMLHVEQQTQRRRNTHTNKQIQKTEGKREPRETKRNANPSTPYGGSGGGGRRGAGKHNKYATNISRTPRKEKAKEMHEWKRSTANHEGVRSKKTQQKTKPRITRARSSGGAAE